jgi:hypothetical protein
MRGEVMSRRLGLSPAATQYGASFGRGSNSPGDFDQSQPVRLRRVNLDSQGYDEGGAYWGHHADPQRGMWRMLYLIEGPAWEPECEARMFIRVPVPIYAGSARACAVAEAKKLGFIVKGRQS